MPEEDKKLPIDFENIKQEDFLEKAFETYLPEDLVHKKLGDIHGRKIKRLTDEEAEIIRRWREWKLKDLPENWQTLIKDADNRPNITQEEYQILLNNQCKHKPEDLRPKGLPDNWEELVKEHPKLKKKLGDAKEMIEALAKEKDN